jgi:hypothetical protein
MYDPATSVYSFRTYAWVNETDEDGNAPLYVSRTTDQRIRQGINEHMNRIGFQQVSNQPDLLIHYHFQLEEKVRELPPHYENDSNSLWFLHWNQYQYCEGTLVIDLMTRTDHQLVWRGFALGILDEEDSGRAIEKVINEIFERFPAGTVVGAPESPTVQLIP